MWSRLQSVFDVYLTLKYLVLMIDLTFIFLEGIFKVEIKMMEEERRRKHVGVNIADIEFYFLLSGYTL